MLYVLYGHQFWARKKLRELLEKARERESALFKLSSASFVPLAGYFSADLFGKKVVLVGEYLLENPEYERELTELAGRLAASDNIVFLLEEGLAQDWEERFRDAGAKLEKFKNLPEEKFFSWARDEALKFGLALSAAELKVLAEEFDFDPWTIAAKLERMSLEKIKISGKNFFSEPNYFQFADLAFARRKYEALKLLRGFVKQGLGGEEAFWKLWWKIKTLRMIDSCLRRQAGQGNLGLHPYVLQKSRADLKNFSSEELKKLSYELLDIFSEVRRGEESFEEGLEKILLKL